MTDATLTPDNLPAKQMGEIRHNSGMRKGMRFANDGSYLSVEAMLTRLATRCMGRVYELDLPMTYDDVRQEMDMTYLQAFKAWNPEGGARFGTYLHTACLNNFRHRVEKMIEERREMGMYSIDSKAPIMDGDDSDPRERIQTLASDDSPEDQLVARQELCERLKGLTPKAQRFVTALLLSQTKGERMTFKGIAKAAGIEGEELKRVKVEITQKFGFAQW